MHITYALLEQCILICLIINMHIIIYIKVLNYIKVSFRSCPGSLVG